MIEGALILLLGMAIGTTGYHFLYKYISKIKEQENKKPYDKYRNIDGLLSRRAVKG